MGLIDFVKDAGEKLFGKSKAEQAAAETAQAAQAAEAKAAEAAVNRAKADALAAQIRALGLKVEHLELEFASGVARVAGSTPTQGDKEKIILVLGNTRGVAQVDDQLVVVKPAPEAALYTVQSGDTLSKIAKAHYGDAAKYPLVFAANQPMLSDPNKIYPGQVLRIPAQS